MNKPDTTPQPDYLPTDAMCLLRAKPAPWWRYWLTGDLPLLAARLRKAFYRWRYH